jgi:hypothetical protein
MKNHFLTGVMALVCLAVAAVVFPHERIDDVFGPDGVLFGKRRLTRPFIDWHPDHGYVGVVHVCADDGPIDGRVYPALVTSSNGAVPTPPPCTAT